MAQHYDVAVIGFDTAGIIAAGLLAKKGHRILLIDHGEHATSYRHHHCHLPFGFSLLPSVEQSNLIQRVHDALGLGPELRPLAASPQVTMQLFLNKDRIDIRQDMAATLTELHTTFPEMQAILKTCIEQLSALDRQFTPLLEQQAALPPEGWRRLWQHYQHGPQIKQLQQPIAQLDWFQAIPTNHPLRQLLMAPLAFFAHLWPQQPSTAMVARLLMRLLRGASPIEHGLYGLKRHLLQAAERAGVTVRRKTLIERLLCKGKTMRTMLIEDERQEHTATVFIHNTNRPLSAFLAAEQRPNRLLVEEQRMPLVGGLLALNVLVPAKLIPEAMAPVAMILHGRQQLRGDEKADPPLLVQRYAGPKEQLAATEQLPPYEIIHACCPVQFSEIIDAPERLRAMKAQILQRLTRSLPFLAEMLIGTSLVTDTSSYEQDNEERNSKIDPWRLHPLYDVGSQPWLGVGGRSTRTAFRNVLHAGKDVMPGLGIEGAYVTGWQTAKQAATYLPK